MGIKPDMITYNGAILPCKKGEQRGKPLLVLEVMHGMGIMPGVITYNASILGSKKGRQQEQTLICLSKCMAWAQSTI